MPSPNRRPFRGLPPPRSLSDSRNTPRRSSDTNHLTSMGEPSSPLLMSHSENAASAAEADAHHTTALRRLT
eukprot:CAMPEP_0174865574 /NCGR_PEP_ID=MMETSP1114-20130205/60611_1 /TAXON_ID=312471 /ORGANISM="Neobodo designis, Strain CCAP 1951/1" /LENGTH=70 /DNA_ID=CAMNT_0016100707 /DNA_START=150 /DNA_END=358 /DNA_ORIENTATION=+